MAKTEYRGIAYDVRKNERGTYGHAPKGWVGAAPGIETGKKYGKPGIEVKGDTKTEAIKRLKIAIDINIDYDGDSDLYYLVERLENFVSRPIAHRDQLVYPSCYEMLRQLDRVYEFAKRAIETRKDPAKQTPKELLRKLRARTVANGCTPAEAAEAAKKLKELSE